jgi:HD-GYP domain-containing protein (c-di-GMP phosphodiesterase class II)
VTQRPDPRLQLISLAGPSPASLSLVPPGPLLIGRRSASALKLAGDDTVSREHAQLEHRRSGSDDVWSLVDLGGKSGTWLNGTRLQANQPVTLRPNDQIVIASWTFQLIDPAIVGGEAVTTEIVLSNQEIESDQALTHIPEVTGTSMAGARLELLLKCSKEIHTATDEHVLAEAVVAAALEGTGFSNAALVRPLKPDGVIERLAGAGQLAGPDAAFSRTLLSAVAGGSLVHWSKQSDSEDVAQSIQQLRIEESMCVPITVGPAVVAALYLDNRGGVTRSIDREDMEYCTGVAKMASLAFANLSRADLEHRLISERQDLLLGTVRALVAAIDAKDTYTRGHSERVAWLARALGEAVELSADDLDALHLCGLVHDVGKIGIPESILRKPSRLTDEEYDVIKSHPAMGCRILEGVTQLAGLMEGVRSHHERWDGGGYPDGLAGEAIPLFGRMLGVADAFDAMRSARAYRGSLDHDHVTDELRNGAGSQFDPELAAAFLDIDLTSYEAMLADHVAQDSESS